MMKAAFDLVPVSDSDNCPVRHAVKLTVEGSYLYVETSSPSRTIVLNLKDVEAVVQAANVMTQYE